MTIPLGGGGGYRHGDTAPYMGGGIEGVSMGQIILCS